MLTIEKYKGTRSERQQQDEDQFFHGILFYG